MPTTLGDAYVLVNHYWLTEDDSEGHEIIGVFTTLDAAEEAADAAALLPTPAWINDQSYDIEHFEVQAS